MMTERSARKPRRHPVLLSTSAITSPWFFAQSLMHQHAGGWDWNIVTAAVMSTIFFDALIDTARAVLLEHREASKQQPIEVRYDFR